jgi:hypothetical protein
MQNPITYHLLRVMSHVSLRSYRGIEYTGARCAMLAACSSAATMLLPCRPVVRAASGPAYPALSSRLATNTLWPKTLSHNDESPLRSTYTINNNPFNQVGMAFRLDGFRTKAQRELDGGHWTNVTDATTLTQTTLYVVKFPTTIRSYGSSIVHV